MKYSWGLGVKDSYVCHQPLFLTKCSTLVVHTLKPQYYWSIQTIQDPNLFNLLVVSGLNTYF